MSDDYMRHGGPYDRGSADSYYCRPFNPHYFTGNTYMSEEISKEYMSDDEIAAYTAGYEENEAQRNWKYYK